jgi:hypothetical protein
MAMIYTLSFMSGSLLLYSLSFLTMKPTYNCEGSQICDPCQNPTSTFSEDSFNTWVTELDLTCILSLLYLFFLGTPNTDSQGEPFDLYTSLSTYQYLGKFLAQLLFSRLPDLYGRKQFHLVSVYA